MRWTLTTHAITAWRFHSFCGLWGIGRTRKMFLWTPSGRFGNNPGDTIHPAASPSRGFSRSLVPARSIARGRTSAGKVELRNLKQTKIPRLVLLSRTASSCPIRAGPYRKLCKRCRNSRKGNEPQRDCSGLGTAIGHNKGSNSERNDASAEEVASVLLGSGVGGLANGHKGGLRSRCTNCGWPRGAQARAERERDSAKPRELGRSRKKRPDAEKILCGMIS